MVKLSQAANMPAPIPSAEDPQSLQLYFEHIRKLLKSGNPFPVRLDDVWPLFYQRKDVVVRVLKKHYIENVDYQVFHQNAENPSAGRPEQIYQISVACLEWLVARKIPAVFEVYRRVFHFSLDLAEAKQAEELHKKNKRLESELHKLVELRAKDQAFIAQFKNVPPPCGHEQSVQREKFFRLLDAYVIGATLKPRPEDVLRDVFRKLETDYLLDLKTFPRLKGEHLIDVALRTGYYRQVHEVLAYQLPYSRNIRIEL